MQRLNLSSEWQLRQEELFWTKDHYSKIIKKQDGWLSIHALPCDVHMPLIENGTIEDPVIGKHSYESEWIEDKSWWFKKTFVLSREQLNNHLCELVAESLDSEADIFINDQWVGHHRSQTYPFCKNVKHFLTEGENTLVIRVTSGLEHYSQSDFACIGEYISLERRNRGDKRRVFVRKPQYVYGWDWNPRIATVGLCGDVYLQFVNEIAIRSACLRTLSLEEESALVEVEVEMEAVRTLSTSEVKIGTEICFGTNTVLTNSHEAVLHAGLNYLTFHMELKNVNLWWPNGMGEQNLYQVLIHAETQNGNGCQYEFTTGIRTINVDLSKINDKERNFCFIVNGKKMFAKGGDWETPDSIYARATPEKYERIIREAKNAHFNMFRYNGVNAYAPDCFYDYCDKYGILLWHDFTFSVAAYPDHLDWFVDEARNELEYRIKKVRSHPCLALWCGSNECQWYMDRNHILELETNHITAAGCDIFNRLIPKLVHTLTPDILYWNTSPFGGEIPNSSEIGDTHEWFNAFFNLDMNIKLAPEVYDQIDSKFVSEFGCIGPAKKASVLKYYGDTEVEVGSETWIHHTNTFEDGAMDAAIKRFYTDEEKLSLDDYLLYAGLFQGMYLGYAFESMRILPKNNGALMWSYNDCWGEVGWSILDYYNVRKISYPFVCRALAPVRLVIRKTAGIYTVYGVNDNLDDFETTIEYGYVSFNGKKSGTKQQNIKIPACDKCVICTFEGEDWNLTEGTVYVSDLRGQVIPALLRGADIRDCKLSKPQLHVELKEASEKEMVFTVSSDTFAHAVHFNLGDDVLLSDEYFDLLPGESRVITAVAEDSGLLKELLAVSVMI